MLAYYVLSPKHEKDGEDKNSEVDLDATLEEDYFSTTKTWKEVGEVSKESEAVHKRRKRHKRSLRTTTNSPWSHTKT